MHDSTALAPNSTGSPFDAIRQVRPDGTEFWSARDLMPMLGYDQWRNFERCITEARRAAEIAGASDQFADSSKLVPTGSGAKRAVVDVHLTRYAAYMVAMSCDGRKPEVAEAKTYFAIRTREAEMQPTKPANQLDILRAAIDQIEVAQREASEAKQIAERSEARLDAIEGRHDWFSALGYARLHRIPNTSSQFLKRVGSQATSVAKARGISPVKVPHQLFGEVNSYPAWVWEIAFAGFEEGDVA